MVARREAIVFWPRWSRIFLIETWSVTNATTLMR